MTAMRNGLPWLLGGAELYFRRPVRFDVMKTPALDLWRNAHLAHTYVLLSTLIVLNVMSLVVMCAFLDAPLLNSVVAAPTANQQFAHD
jgi:hypothetical protein